MVRGVKRIVVTAAIVAVAALAPVCRADAVETQARLPVPRFVSLRSDKVNLRTGPGDRYPIEWVLTRKDMPVQIVAEFEHWRRIRDFEGTEGWVHERMLDGKRDIVVTGAVRPLRRQPVANAAVVARAEPGVVARLLECQGPWCRVDAGEATGWMRRDEIWGVLPDETIE
jgi:SH3-like domain-containing protein